MNERKNVVDTIREWILHGSPLKVIISGYLIVILAGTLLLFLPISSRCDGVVPFSDCLFTATSATCVTGLIRYDTYTCWTLFGQVVILGLIQIGGVGFMTLVISGMRITGKRIGIRSRILMQNSISAQQMGGIVATTRFVLRFTLLIEAIGAVLLSIRFVPKVGILRGIWFGIFHSISAFCNAGFDLCGTFSPGSSITTMVEDPLVNLVLVALIVTGGLGFFVWKDLLEHKWHFNQLRLQSKLVIVTSVVLLIGGAAAIWLMEMGSSDFEQLSVGGKILASLFQSTTSRTAGFNTLDLSAMTSGAQMVMIFLMMIGGSPGSTAGGMKTTTLAVQLLSIRTVFMGEKSVRAFRRSIEDEVVRTASCVTALYLILAIGSALILSGLEQLPVMTTLFETVSAVATVGVTLGITAHVGMVSKIILILLMIIGRAGSLTILMAAADHVKKTPRSFPVEKVTVG